MSRPTFNLRIVFTGICTLVTDKPFSQAPSEVHLVLLDGWADKKTTNTQSMDGREYLVRHGAMVQFSLRNAFGGGLPRDGRGVWYPNRHRLSFDFLEAPNAPNTFEVEQDLSIHVADMARIAPRYSRIGDKEGVLHAERPPRQVLANASFNRGKLSVDLNSVNSWGFSGVLAGSPVKIEGMAYRVVLSLCQLEKVTLSAVPFKNGITSQPGNPGHGLPEVLEILGDQDETVEITIANLCDENSLNWSVADLPEEDRDFKWHYEILPEEARKHLVEDLLGTELPFPILKREPPAGRGRNCFPGFYSI